MSISVHIPYERPRVHGRFLFRGDEKFFVKGVTYGPFAPNAAEEPFPEPLRTAEDFAAMAASGINTVRVYDVPPAWLLEFAGSYGLYLLVGISWPQHICFLDQWDVQEAIEATVRRAVRACRAHPNVLAYLIGNEIPKHIVRWHGPKQISAFLKKLTDIVHEEDPTALATYANYPSTEYLRLDFLDFYSINVYLQDEHAFCRYVKRLQNVAGNLPLVLSEFGLDSWRNGDEEQARTLSWQLRDAFALGVSGTFVFAWTDEWFTGGHAIDDWSFGLVDRERNLKPAHAAVRDAYMENVPPPLAEEPAISVVVCAYNADSTLNECLASFLKVKYSAFEVIVVDDGAKDDTGMIADWYAAEYPHMFRVIHQPNRGLSYARNAGMYAAKGAIVAYTDADCYIDPHWLHYMALAFRDERFAAIGGPNLAPEEDNLIAACVSVSPGAPTHVLLTDEIAEHIPGCNMAFRRNVLLSIRGFDDRYRAAGDDVDVCWRLQNMGYDVGFSASMTVWHHRRNTVKAYLRQQMGYGRSEALLAPKHPERFNGLGNSRWAGRIYGDISGHVLTARPVIYHGVFGSSLFQTLYAPKANVMNHLPLSFEWISASLMSLMLGYFYPTLGAAGLAMSAATLAWCIHRAWQASLPPQHDGWKARAMITALTWLQPVVRGWARYRTLLDLGIARGRQYKEVVKAARAWLSFDGLAAGSSVRQIWAEALTLIRHRFSFQIFFWNHAGLERSEVIDDLFVWLKNLRLKPTPDSGYASVLRRPSWDMQIESGFWSKMPLRITVEHHGGMKRFVRLGGSVKPTSLAMKCSGISVALAGGAFIEHFSLLALVLAAVAARFIILVAWDHLRAAAIVSLLSRHFAAADTGSSVAIDRDAVADIEAEPDLEGIG